MKHKKGYLRKQFWITLPWNAYSVFLIAIFFMFSGIGIISDLFDGGQRPVPILLANTLFAGLISVGYAYCATRNLKLFPAVILLHVAVAVMAPDVSGMVTADSAMQNRLRWDGLALLLSTMLGYIFFVIFIGNQGVRYFSLQTEMKLAKQMHDVLVPPVQLKNQRFEVYGRSLPTAEVGGDLLDAYETREHMTCLVADVSGHGVAAGQLMGMFKSALYVNLHNDEPLLSIIENVNQTLYRLKQRNMFLTLAAFRFTSEKKAEFSVAGHLPILHYRAATRDIEHLTCKQIALALKKKYAFVTKSVSFASGDVFVLLTDGLVEVSDKRGKEFSLERIETLMLQNRSLDSKALFEHILNAVNDYGPQRDDQTMLIIRCL